MRAKLTHKPNYHFTFDVELMFDANSSLPVFMATGASGVRGRDSEFMLSRWESFVSPS